MARTDVAVTKITRAGVFPAGAVGSADGHMFKNTGKEFIQVKNADASAHQVTVQTTEEFEGLALADLSVSVPATSERLIGPFPRHIFGQKSGADKDKVYVNYASGSEAQMTLRVFSS